jgi:hypothetical protein
MINQLDLRIADIVIDAGPVFGGNGRGSVRTANGWLSKVVNEGRYFEALQGNGQANSQVALTKPINARHFGHGPRHRHGSLLPQASGMA